MATLVDGLPDGLKGSQAAGPIGPDTKLDARSERPPKPAAVRELIVDVELPCQESGQFLETPRRRQERAEVPRGRPAKGGHGDVAGEVGDVLEVGDPS
jgi:hypothetical protein